MSLAARSFYDAVVLGARPASLLAAALLARRGFRVCVVRHDDRPHGYAFGGLLFRRGPEALTCVDSAVFRRVLGELALRTTVQRKLTAAQPAFQLVTPAHRIDGSSASEAVFREVDREFASVRRAAEDLFAHCDRVGRALDAVLALDLQWPVEGFFEKRRVRRALRETGYKRDGRGADPLAGLPDGHALRALVAGAGTFATNADPSALPPLLACRALGAQLRGAGAHTFEGGRDALVQLCEEKIAQHGGELRPRDRVARVLTARGAVEGVQLDTTDEVLGCSFVLAPYDEYDALSLAEHESVTSGRALATRAERVREGYTLNLAIEASGLPMGLGSRAFVVHDPRRPLEGANLLLLERAGPDAQGRVVLTASAVYRRAHEYDPDGVAGTHDGLARRRHEVREAVARCVPFLERNLIAVDSPHDGLPCEVLRPERLDGVASREPTVPRSRGAREPMELRVRTDAESLLGASASPVECAVKRLLAIGPPVLAGLGEEGELLAAVSAARIVTRSDPSRERMRRELWSRAEG